MAISNTSITTWQGLGEYLLNLKDRNGNNFFSNVDYSGDIKLYTDGNLMAEISTSAYVKLMLHSVSGKQTTTKQSSNAIDVAYTQTFHTRNGCCINLYSSSGNFEYYIGVGKTQNGETFVCAGTPRRESIDSPPLNCSHIYNSIKPYVNIEGASILAGQTALYAEPVATVEGEKDRWNKFYFNKCTQVEYGSGAMTFEGSVYYTNTFISIVDD